MEKLTPQARKLLADLDAELAAVSAARGERLSWSAAEVQLREILAATIDRRADMAGRYERARETKVRVKISAELRQLDNAIARLLNQIKTDGPDEESLTTVKNRRAANIRWDRERQRNASA